MSTTPLPIDQFAKKVRDKYPGAYDHLSDAQLVGKVVDKYPQYKDNIASYAQTQFEKDRSGEGPDSGFVSGVQSSIGNATPPATAGQAVKEGVLSGMPGVGFAKSLIDTAKNAPANYRAGGAAGVLGPLVGIDPVSMRARAERADTAGIVGEAAIPTATALAAPVMQGIGAMKGAAGRALVDSTGRPNPIPRLILGNERAQALGEVMNPDIADARVAAKAKMDALSAGRTAPGPWRPGLKPMPELGSPGNPGMFSPIPTRMPKPAYTPLVDSPNFNINKEKMLTGQATSLTDSPNYNINKERALTGQSVPVSESPYYTQNKAVLAQEAQDRQPVPVSQSPYYNRTQELLKPVKPAPIDPFAGMTSSDKPVGNAALPELRGNATPFGPPVQLVDKFAPPATANQKSIIQSPDSPPPPRKVTYQSAAQGDLLRLVKSGDRAAIAEWDRRSLPRPPGVSYMVEDSPTLPWRNPGQ